MGIGVGCERRCSGRDFGPLLGVAVHGACAGRVLWLADGVVVVCLSGTAPLRIQPGRAWVGWACFACVVLGLMWQAADMPLFPYTVGWPLIGPLVFGVSLWRLRSLPQEVAPLVPRADAGMAPIKRDY